MGIFSRKKKQHNRSVNSAAARMAQDGMVKCLADMSADQFMMRQGYVPLHEKRRTEMRLWPGEMPLMPLIHVYFKPDAQPAFTVAAISWMDGEGLIGPSLDAAGGQLGSIVGSEETAAKIRAAGYEQAIVRFDSSKHIDSAVSIEKVSEVAAAAS